MHRNRRWGVSAVTSAEELAHMLTERTWTLCSGFYVAGHEDYLFLNDSTHEDGAGEYAACRGGIYSKEFVQIESITFSWCDYAKALAYILQALAGCWDANEFAAPVTLHVEAAERHRRCHLCS